MLPAVVHLEDGTTFSGLIPGPLRTPVSEVVFTTGMTGYEETLTDPSYTGQIITFTYPLIGNYGVLPKDMWESARIFADGVILGDACANPSHPQSTTTLLSWLKKQKIPVLTGVDTRALTLHIREHGTMRGVIMATHDPAPVFDGALTSQEATLRRVSANQKVMYGKGKKRIILVDCGLKENILRSLQSFPWEIVRVPFDYDYSEEHFDGIVLSNGPGDPSQCTDTIRILRLAMMKEKPIFGICLGMQLLGLAAGGETYKLPYGHRGYNQPCQDSRSGRCVMTSQNHGYAIRDTSLPSGWQVTYRNLNDQTVEGIAHTVLPFMAVQFHPEAAPGPHDTAGLFADFFHMVTDKMS